MTHPCPKAAAGLLAVLGLALVYPSCQHKGRRLGRTGPGFATNALTQQRTLSGRVLMQQMLGGGGLPGVTVRVRHADGSPAGPGGAELEVVTDLGGGFIVLDPPAGAADVRFDGTSAAVPGASFGRVELRIAVEVEGPTDLPMALSLPCLSGAETATAVVSMTPGGTATAPVAVAGSNPSVALSGPAGVAISVGGVPATTRVTLQVTPVAPVDVPVQLFDTVLGTPLEATSYAAIEPLGVSFDTGAGVGGLPGGLDLALPNDRGFPAGSSVDIWALEKTGWVNRSQQTGAQGVVDATGTVVEASGVVFGGGLHAAALPTVPLCATTIFGRVVDQLGDPIPSVVVSTSTGQIGLTATDGTFAVADVAAYAGAPARQAIPVCVPQPLTVELLAPLAYGGERTARPIAAGRVVLGGFTDVNDPTGDISVPVRRTGHLVGRVTDNGVPLAGLDLAVFGSARTEVTTDDNGAFYALDLEPGVHIASAQFPDALFPFTFRLEIGPNEVAAAAIQGSFGGGGETVLVLVLYDDDDDSATPMIRAAGSKVLLRGTDSVSAAGVSAVTNTDGVASFYEVTGPFDVTAQHDVEVRTVPPESARLASSVFGISPAAGTIAVPITGLNPSAGFILDATLSGTVANRPAAGSGTLSVVVGNRAGFFGAAPVDPATGQYSVAIPSGQVVDAVVLHELCSGGACVPAAAQLAFGVAPAAPSGTVTVDFDFGSSATFAFDQMASVTYNNVPASLCVPPGAQYGVGSLRLADSSGGSFRFLLFAVLPGSGGLPATLQLPDLGNGPLSGIAAQLDIDLVYSCFGAQPHVASCSRPVTTTTGITYDFVGVPGVVGLPGPVTPAVAAGMTVEFTEGAGAVTTGLNIVRIASANPGSSLGVQRMGWTLFAPLGATSVTLPSTLEPMFAAPGSYGISVETLRSAGLPSSLNELFAVDVEQTWAALESVGACSSSHGATFRTQ